MSEFNASLALESAVKMKQEGVSAIAAIKALRERFGMDLLQAKGFVTLASANLNLEEHQGNLAPALTQLFQEMDDDDEDWGSAQIEGRLNVLLSK